jgi:hypothetical protein
VGGFGAEPGQVQQGSGEGSREGWEALAQSQVRFNRVPDQVLEKIWEALVQSPVRFNRVPKKVPEKEAEPGQVQQGSGEGSGEGSRKPWCKAKSGSAGSRRRLQRRPRKRVWESLVEGQVRFNRFNRVSSAWLRSTLQKDL